MAISDTDEQLIPFLKNLTNLLETNKITSSQLQCLGEFYMTYTLLEKENETCFEDNEDIDSKEVIKFLTLGWYFYKVLKTQN
jgi:hypothetical protein